MELSDFYANRAKAIRNVANFLAVRIKARRVYGLKAVGDNYRKKFAEIVDKHSGDNLARADLIAEIIKNILTYATLAYEEGKAEGGQSGAVSAEEKQSIGAWVALQSTFAGGLADAIIEARTLEGEAAAAAMDDLIARVDMWQASLETMRLEGLASAADPMVKWVLDPAKQNCHTEGDTIGCVDLNNQRHKLSWFLERGYIPRTPGSKTTCEGWLCGCKLVDDSGVQVM